MTQEELDLISSRIATIIRMEHSESSLQGKLDAQRSAIFQHISNELRGFAAMLTHLVKEAMTEAIRELLREPRPGTADLYDALSTRIKDVSWSTRTRGSLELAGLVCLGEIVQKGDQAMLRIHGFGRRSLEEVTAVLAEYNLHFGMDISGWSLYDAMAKRLRNTPLSAA